MDSRFIVRLVDLALLLLLSLLLAARISPPDVELPRSEELDTPGATALPLEVAFTAAGTILLGQDALTAAEFALLAEYEARPVLLRVDAAAEAERLLAIHAILQASDRPANFLVHYKIQ